MYLAYIRQPRVINRPAALQQPKQCQVSKPPYNIHLAPFDSRAPLPGRRIQRRALFVGHCVVCKSHPDADHVRCCRFRCVENLRMKLLTSGILYWFGGRRLTIAQTMSASSIASPRHPAWRMFRQNRSITTNTVTAKKDHDS